METYERRLKNFRSEVRFEWNDAYEMGVQRLDRQHKEMFQILDEISAMAEGRQSGDGAAGMVDRFINLARSHLKYEETLLSREPWLTSRQWSAGTTSSFASWRACASTWRKRPADALQTTIAFLKDWAIDHSLVENSRLKTALS